MSNIYNVLDWITKLAYINLLWIIFTLAGGVILGIYPATIAMFASVREWLHGKSDLPVLKTFWGFYKQDFLKSNLIGLFLNVLFAFILIDIYYIQVNLNESLSWTYIPLFAFMIFVILFLLYIFPCFVHYDLKIVPLMKNALLIMIISPIHSFLMMVCIVSLIFIAQAIPALFFIFGSVTYAFITTWISQHAFDRIQNKKVLKD